MCDVWVRRIQKFANEQEQQLGYKYYTEFMTE